MSDSNKNLERKYIDINPVMMGPDPYRHASDDRFFAGSESSMFDVLYSMLETYDCSCAHIELLNSQHIIVRPQNKQAHDDGETG